MITENDKVVLDSPGDTSQRCETAPGILYYGGFSPKSKPERALSIHEQAMKLQEKGLCNGTDALSFLLCKTSYHHLKPYHALFMTESGKFKNGVTINALMGACNFDRCLQAVLLKYIGLIEVRFRCVVSYHLAKERGIFSHIDLNVFDDRKRAVGAIKRYREERDRRLRLGDAFAKEYMDRYGELPIWAAVEVMSMGTLSKLFQNIESSKLKKAISSSYKVPPRTLEGWLRTLSYTRNECAHFGTLYGKELIKESQRVKAFDPYDNRSLFHVCAIVQFLLSTDSRTYSKAFPGELQGTIDAFKADKPLMGFPDSRKRQMENLIQDLPKTITKFRPGKSPVVERMDPRTFI